MNRIILIISVFALLQSCQSDMEKSYYPSGNLEYKVPLSNGEYHGEMISYYENGKIKGKAIFENGDLRGEAIGYDSLGNLYSTYQYQDNKKNGSFKIYYPDGSVHVEGEYNEGKPHGKGFEYYPNGGLMRKYVYSMGELIYMKAYTKEGVQYDSKLDINISKTVNKDSVVIELGYTEYDSAGFLVAFGNLDANNRLIDTLAIYGTRDLDLKYKVDSNQKILSGVLFELKLPEETIEAAYYFKYDL